MAIIDVVVGDGAILVSNLWWLYILLCACICIVCVCVFVFCVCVVHVWLCICVCVCMCWCGCVCVWVVYEDKTYCDLNGESTLRVITISISISS